MNAASKLILFFVCLNLSYIPNSIGQNNSNPDADDIEVTKHKDWAVQCENATQDGLVSCFMFQRILVKDSGESLLRMTVDQPQGLAAQRAIFVIPLGTYVTPGISVKIDSNDSINLEIEYCDKKGCYAGILLDHSILTMLKGGREAVVSFQNRGRQEISLPISLNGFTSGLAALKR
jgi:invasion protein IalB